MTWLHLKTRPTLQAVCERRTEEWARTTSQGSKLASQEITCGSKDLTGLHRRELTRQDQSKTHHWTEIWSHWETKENWLCSMKGTWLSQTSLRPIQRVSVNRKCKLKHHNRSGHLSKGSEFHLKGGYKTMLRISGPWSPTIRWPETFLRCLLILNRCLHLTEREQRRQ